VFGGKTDTDTYAFDIRALDGGDLSSKELSKCQSMAISDTNGRVDGQVITMKVQDILVHVISISIDIYIHIHMKYK